jgi:hypothetical protein
MVPAEFTPLGETRDKAAHTFFKKRASSPRKPVRLLRSREPSRLSLGISGCRSRLALGLHAVSAAPWAESWPECAVDARSGAMTVLTYSITDWLHAPGARQAHLRRGAKTQENSPDFVGLLCDQLGENSADRRLRAALQRIARRLGQERVEHLVERARVIHAGSGMLVKDGSRRRTLGGVFFQLAKQERRHCAPLRCGTPGEAIRAADRGEPPLQRHMPRSTDDAAAAISSGQGEQLPRASDALFGSVGAGLEMTTAVARLVAAAVGACAPEPEGLSEEATAVHTVFPSQSLAYTR